jgi:hypothetical protein
MYDHDQCTMMRLRRRGRGRRQWLLLLLLLQLHMFCSLSSPTTTTTTTTTTKTTATNILLLITDDQDVMLGTFDYMPNVKGELGDTTRFMIFVIHYYNVIHVLYMLLDVVVSISTFHLYTLYHFLNTCTLLYWLFCSLVTRTRHYF